MPTEPGWILIQTDPDRLISEWICNFFPCLEKNDYNVPKFVRTKLHVARHRFCNQWQQCSGRLPQQPQVTMVID